MEESEFNQKVDDILVTIEESLDNCDADLDWDLAGGILTIECENGSQVIVNRQGPTQQIWVASRGGGFHFDFCEQEGEGKDAEKECWRQGELELFTLLNQALSEQSGEKVKLD
jgi:CyaY protein